MKLLRFMIVLTLLSGCARKEFNNPNDPKNAPPPLELHSPSDGSITPDNPPEFVWAKVEGAELYALQVDDDPEFGSPELVWYEDDWGDTCYTPSHCFDAPSYYWRVKAVGDVGFDRDWSPIRSFSVKYPLIATYTTDGDYVENVWVKDGLAYLAVIGGDRDMEIVDVSDPSSPHLISSLELAGSVNIVAILVEGDYAYLADYNGGLYVVDVSNPSQPRQIGHCETTHLYDISVTANYLCAVGGYPDLLIIDVTYPEDPRVISSYAGPGYGYAVSAEGDYAYLASWVAGLQIVHLCWDPFSSSPRLVGSCEDLNEAVDVFVGDDYAFVADRETGLQIVEVSDPSSPEIVGSCEMPGARTVCVSGSYACLGDYYGVLRIVDVSQFSFPEIVGSCGPLVDLRRAFAHGSYAYLACGDSGLNIVRVE